ncbi:MAG: hypothetical protein Q8R06_07745 [Polaromonas sp.]|uniref:hypothetical protein n=1 Tax=Polaromonas sp. TaxID=1869339 RepID=UPI002733AAC8|nr:hypothetical protein [Polaromonas sp.]MDP3797029.1 hypothetical protein [Polaromonas sp.]
MSLVIAKAHKGKIYIVGDTALTYHNNPGANPFVSGCLKQYRVNERLAVAFAGDTAGFRDACSDIFASTDSSEIIEVARKAQKKGHEFDLLVAEVGNDNITFLKAGVVSEGSSGFIGDSEAFGVFQKHSHAVV